MAKGVMKSGRRSVPKVSKIRRTSSMEKCIEDGKEFIKSRRPKPIMKIAPVPASLPIKKRATRKLKVKKAVPSKPAPKARGRKILGVKPSKIFKKTALKTGGLFGSSAPASSSIFGGGLFGSSGTLTSGVEFHSGKKP